MFTPPLAIDFQIFSSHLCQSLYDVKQKAAQLELSSLLAIRFHIPITAWDSAVTIKGSQRMRDWRIFFKISLFNKYLLNDPTFGQIHLAGQYL
jgi:hypothetical protein